MTVRIGFIGVGFMGQMAHLHSFSQVPGCQIAAIAEIRPQLAREVARKYHIPAIYATHAELLADPSIDAVVCSQPYHRNYPLGRDVLRAGKSLFTEKPMAARLDDARELVSLAEEKGVTYAVGFMKRHDPGVLVARQAINQFRNSGELGALRMIDTTCFLGDWLQNPGKAISSDEPMPAEEAGARYPDFLATSKREDYDHFLNIYSHNVNLLHFLLPGEPIVCDSVLQRGHSFLVSMHHGDTVISLRGVPTRSHQWEETTTLVFSEGRVHIQSATPLNRQAVADVSIYHEIDGVFTERKLFPPIEWAFLRHARAFVDAVANKTPLSTAGLECLHDVALMEDIFARLGD